MDLTIRGEASETDDESTLDIGLQKKHILASEVSGEATESESDEEIFEKSLKSSSTEQTYFSSNILQQKLISSNLTVLKTLKNIAKDYVSSSSKTLINSDNLIKTQLISMQIVLSSLKTCNENTKQLRERTERLLPNNFIPDIQINAN